MTFINHSDWFRLWETTHLSLKQKHQLCCLPWQTVHLQSCASSDCRNTHHYTTLHNTTLWHTTHLLSNFQTRLLCLAQHKVYHKILVTNVAFSNKHKKFTLKSYWFFLVQSSCSKTNHAHLLPWLSKKLWTIESMHLTERSISITAYSFISG